MAPGLRRTAAPLAVLAILSAGFLCAAVWAQSSGGDFKVAGHTVDGGGSLSSGGAYRLAGTIGQHDANVTAASGPAFAVAGGFWARVVLAELLFRDGFETP